jgi:hypothetical protein
VRNYSVHGLFLIAVAFYLHSNVLAEPFAIIDPTCGPVENGFNLGISTNGFNPNSTVAWKLVNSTQSIPIFGYFQTNSTGGFSDYTFLNEIGPDKYKMYFGDDADNDGKFDMINRTTYANLTIPCPNP